MSHVVIDCAHICGLHISFCLIYSIIYRNDSFTCVTMFCIYIQLILCYYIWSYFRGVVFNCAVNATDSFFVVFSCAVNTMTVFFYY
jgi:hypothetical protein